MSILAIVWPSTTFLHTVHTLPNWPSSSVVAGTSSGSSPKTWPVAWISSWASKIVSHLPQYEPAVKPVSVQVASLPGSATTSWPPNEGITWVSIVLQAEHTLVCSPSSAHEASLVVVQSPYVCSRGATSLFSVYWQPVQMRKSLPAVVQVAGVDLDVSTINLWPRAGICSCSTRIFWQVVHFLPSLKPLVSQSAAEPGITSSVWPLAGISSSLSASQREHLPFALPGSSQVASKLTVVSKTKSWPRAAITVVSLTLALHTVHSIPAVLPSVVQVAATAGISFSVWASLSATLVSFVLQTLQVASSTPATAQVGADLTTHSPNVWATLATGCEAVVTTLHIRHS